MRRTAPDLQLDADPSARFLPWLIFVMVFLATVALAGAIALNALVVDWRDSASDTATVQIAVDDSHDMDRKVADALALLRRTPGIAAAEPLAEEQVDRLLEPWLGPDSAASGLPVPRLIDVALEPDHGIDLAALAVKLAAAVPGASLDDHEPWLERLVSLARSIQGLALAVVAIVGTATVAIIVFATRAGLAAHADAIEVLHLIGARDGYIARQFRRHCLKSALKGGIPGATLAALAVAVIAILGARLETPLLASSTLGLGDWIALALPPVAGAVLATLTAHLTVLRVLKRML